MSREAWYTYIRIRTCTTIIQLNEWGCRDGMDHVNNRGNKEIPLAILSRILAQSCITLCLNMLGVIATLGVTVLVHSLIDLVLPLYYLLQCAFLYNAKLSTMIIFPLCNSCSVSQSP